MHIRFPSRRELKAMTPEQREELANRIADSAYVRGKYIRHYAEGIGKAGEVLSPVWELIAWRRFP